MEQNTYNKCPVCSFPLSLESAVCPRCGNDILEDISSLDQQSEELHRKTMDEKKAEWYTWCITENLNISDNELSTKPPDREKTSESRHLFSTPDEQELLRTASKAILLKDHSLRKKWWQALSADWKEVIKNTIKIVREPNDQEILDFFQTTHFRCDNRRIHDLWPIRILENLVQLRCDESPVESLEPLAHLSSLQRIYAFDCDFSSLEPFAN